MGSWIVCSCSARIHKNLFTGTGVCVLVADEYLDQIPSEGSANEAMDVVIVKGEVVVQCKQCGRLYIERKGSHIYECFVRERISRSPDFLDSTSDLGAGNSQTDT